MSFSSFKLHASLLRGVADLGFSNPTPIQRDGIPPALEGRDVLGCAMTGSGKTATFVLPVLQRLTGSKRGTTRALVLAPTRELAAQIVEHFNDLGRHTRIRAAAVYGGVGMEPQKRALECGVDVVVACPGRLLDHMKHPYARFDGLEVLVFDEADRMLDMGFLPDIRRVLRQLPLPEQTLLFSATMPRPIVELSRQLLRNPVRLDVERPAAPATGVRQSIYPVRQDLKPSLLLELLEREEISNALVFTRTKHRANRLQRFLDKRGVPCERVHGNRSQSQRTQALEGFKKGRYRVLVATDVAARGIDIEALSHVVNFDVPNIPEDYIHRVGRTARAGATGEAFTFVSPQERGELSTIERKVGKSLPRRKLADFDYVTPPAERFEIPIGERIAEIRARKAEERARARAKAEKKAERLAAEKKAAEKKAAEKKAAEKKAAEKKAAEKKATQDRKGNPSRRRSRRRPPRSATPGQSQGSPESTAGSPRPKRRRRRRRRPAGRDNAGSISS